MGILFARLFGCLDKTGFWNVQVWEFSFRSLPRKYAWLFFWKAVLTHPIKAVRGLRRYRLFIRTNHNRTPEYARFISIPDRDLFLKSFPGVKSRPLLGLGFCLKPNEPNDPLRSCPSGRANHDCFYLERGEKRPVCQACEIYQIAERCLDRGCPIYIMTSAKDIAKDFMIPQISRSSFPSAILFLCPYSVQAIILPLLICGVEIALFPYALASCADYEQWLKADRGIKGERTILDPETRKTVLDLLEKIELEKEGARRVGRQRRFRRSGNIFYPV